MQPLDANIAVSYIDATKLVGPWQAYQGHGFDAIYLNPKLGGNRPFIDLVLCVLDGQHPSCAPQIKPTGASGSDAASAPPALANFHKATFVSPTSAQMQPDDAAPAYPKDAIARLITRYELTRPQYGAEADALEAYAQATWGFWETARKKNAYDTAVRTANIRAIEAQICLQKTLEDSRRAPFLKDRFLVDVQSILASTLSAFKDYLHADLLTDGQALVVAADSATVCHPEDFINRGL